MKKYISLFLILCITSLFAQNKSTVIYSDNLTHDNLQVDIFKQDTCFIYSVSTSAMWTGKKSTKIIYKSNYKDFLSFIASLKEFAENNKDNIGAQTTIHGITIQSTKQMGIKCIAIGDGEDITYTRYKSISKMEEALQKWILKLKNI